MPKKAAQFRVDPRLASLLGESYRSSEHAIKELIDNAWDADADNVWITLPDAVTDKPIVVQDDGSGMTEAELRREYLNIASDRRVRKGDKTRLKGRPVKGRKGIGKFAGLVAADTMEIATRARGKQTTLRITKQALLVTKRDLERINLPINSIKCDKEGRGTTITLSELNQKLSFPTSEALRELLALEYGRERQFTIYVNDEPLAHKDIPGKKFTAETTLSDETVVKVSFTIMEDSVPKRQAGVVIRVGGKVIGRPSFLGLEESGLLPSKLLYRVVGEIETDGLEGEITSDGGAIIANSKAFQEIEVWAKDQVESQLKVVFKRDVNLAKARQQKAIRGRLAQLPEHRRQFANEQLQRVLEKFYGEADDKIDTIVSFVLDAIEKDEYWIVVRKIEEARKADVITFAEALDSFGVADLAVMGRQARGRMALLDALDALMTNSKTLEKEMHKALENNLWVFGIEYSVLASNQTLAQVIENFTKTKFKGTRAKKRPDLLLSRDPNQRLLLIEFKRPSATIGRDAEAQTRKYRDDLATSHGAMEALVVGGKIDHSMTTLYPQADDLKCVTYAAIVSRARAQLNWLLKELTTYGGFVSQSAS